MRIAELSAFHPYRGGIAQFGAALHKALAVQHEVKAFTFTRQYPGFLFPGKSQFVEADDTATDVGAVRVLDSVWPLNWGAAANRIALEKPELLLTRMWMPFFGPAMGAVAARVRRTGAKAIGIVDNAVPHEPRFFDKDFARYYFKRHNGFIALSQAVADDIRALKPDAQVQVLPHPLYDHFGTRWDRSAAAAHLGVDPALKTILFFGLIRDYKGLDLLIEAFGQLDGTHQLVIAGEAYGDFAPYQRMIDAHPLRERIHVFQRFIADAEVPAYFSAADCLVLPYRTATQSGVTAIAFHFGVPVIATDVGGLAETVMHERTGLMVPRPDADAIAQGLKTFFEGDRSQRMRDNFDAVRNELSWARFADGLVTFAKGL
ncbi:MAG: glycosyltransferase [Flavobacteriales bacterium]|nr:MAG: glycosyltransferase [Flavobacteriales bacterium]